MMKLLAGIAAGVVIGTAATATGGTLRDAYVKRGERS